jgi:hypothetical protein
MKAWFRRCVLARWVLGVRRLEVRIMGNVVSELRGTLGDDAVLTGEAVGSRARIWRSEGIRAMAIVRLRSTEDVSRALAICHRHGQSG